MQEERKYNRYVKPATGFFEKNKVAVESPRLLDYLSSTLGVLERLRGGQLDDDEVASERMSEQQRTAESAMLVGAIAQEVCRPAWRGKRRRLALPFCIYYYCYCIIIVHLFALRLCVYLDEMSDSLFFQDLLILFLSQLSSHSQVTSSGKDLQALCCHPDASMLLEAFLDWTQLTHLSAIVNAFAQVKPGGDGSASVCCVCALCLSIFFFFFFFGGF
jgi:hypothetical protein